MSNDCCRLVEAVLFNFHFRSFSFLLFLFFAFLYFWGCRVLLLSSTERYDYASFALLLECLCRLLSMWSALEILLVTERKTSKGKKKRDGVIWWGSGIRWRHSVGETCSLYFFSTGENIWGISHRIQAQLGWRKNDGLVSSLRCLFNHLYCASNTIVLEAVNSTRSEPAWIASVADRRKKNINMRKWRKCGLKTGRT